MRITKETILAIGLIASSLTLNSCDDNDTMRCYSAQLPLSRCILLRLTASSCNLMNQRRLYLPI